MRRVWLPIIFLMIASALVDIAVEARPIPGTLSVRANCVEDDDTNARIRDEVASYARSRGLSENAFIRRVGTSIINIEELGCAAEMSGNSVPAAMQALEDFNTFVAGRGLPGSELSRWVALCKQNACEAAAKKLEEELPAASHRAPASM